MRILYNSKNLIFKNPYGCLEQGKDCTINIHIPESCRTKKVFLCFDGEKDLNIELFRTCTKDAYDVFSTTFVLNDTGLYFYRFHIETEESEFDLFKYGYEDTNIGEGEKWQLSCIPEYRVNDQFKGKVIYQIFPDRFYKSGECDLSQKLGPYIIHENSAESPCYLPDEKGEILNNDFFGGNLKGIEEKLPYLNELGVEIIYLNPIFKAFSNHRYDTCDYKTIDPMLGTIEDFKCLCEKAHSYGIKILLDGVFSHTGSDSIYFDEKNRFGTGVKSSVNSPYKSWFNISENGEYDCWWGIKTLPCVNELSQSFTEYIITGKDSVIKHWLSHGADGFRLDVADELPDEFIKLLHKEVHKINPDALVLGEVWEDASNKIAYSIQRRYFTDMELDSVMNYPFRDAIISFVKESISTEEFANKILTITENYPKEVTDCLMNSLSTHDTARILTVLSEAPLDMTRNANAQYTLTDKQLKTAHSLVKLAVMLQFFLPGCACIYYGDEIGMTGFGDPFNRGYFNWNNTENEINDFYRAMANIKNQNSVFKKGTLNILKKDENILIMERQEGKQSIFAAINLSDEAIKINTSNCIMCNNATYYEGTVYVQKNGFAIYF